MGKKRVAWSLFGRLLIGRNLREREKMSERERTRDKHRHKRVCKRENTQFNIAKVIQVHLSFTGIIVM